jgi:glycoside hydrolase-like protein
MSNRGFDTAANVLNFASDFKAAGYDFAALYLGRNLTRAVADEYSRQGIYLVSIGEWDPTFPGYFSHNQGLIDGRRWLADAIAVGQPKGSLIYPTVDYNAGSNDLAAIDAYFTALRSIVLPGNYLVSAYANGLVLQYLLSRGLIHDAWLPMASGWRGSRGYTGEALHQTVGASVDGIGVDVDWSNGAAGGWLIPSAQLIQDGIVTNAD